MSAHADRSHDDDVPHIGVLIFEQRKAAGLSQEQLARRIGVSERTVRSWENQDSTPRANILGAVERALSTRLVRDADGGYRAVPGAPTIEDHEAMAVDSPAGVLVVYLDRRYLARFDEDEQQRMRMAAALAAQREGAAIEQERPRPSGEQPIPGGD